MSVLTAGEWIAVACVLGTMLSTVAGAAWWMSRTYTTLCQVRDELIAFCNQVRNEHAATMVAIGEIHNALHAHELRIQAVELGVSRQHEQ